MTALLPLVHPLVAEFVNDPSRVHDAVSRFESPLNVVFPEVVAENVAGFRAALDESGLSWRMRYAHKVNQSGTLARAARAAGTGVDVASPAELAHALACGFTPDEIEVTGPKGDRFLRALAGRGVTVNVDDVWELRRLAEHARLAEVRERVLIRLSGFAGSRISRFGVPLPDLDEALDVVMENRDALDLVGFSFHLDTGEVREKVLAAAACMAAVESAACRGLAVRVLNIGGGFRQAFAADPVGFDAYVRALRDGLAGAGPSMAWRGATFGYMVGSGVGAVRGVPAFHKYGNDTPGPASLRELLASPLPGSERRTVADAVRELMLQLWIEPGKALVDHAGVTIATVEYTKRAVDGSLLVNLDLTRDAISPADQEVMLDPLLVPRTAADTDRTPPAARPCGAYLAGALCLERDMVSNHLVTLPDTPRPGDVLVFVNTAAYQMDLSAAQAMMRPRTPKVAVVGLDLIPDS